MIEETFMGACETLATYCLSSTDDHHTPKAFTDKLIWALHLTYLYGEKFEMPTSSCKAHVPWCKGLVVQCLCYTPSIFWMLATWFAWLYWIVCQPVNISLATWQMCVCVELFECWSVVCARAGVSLFVHTMPANLLLSKTHRKHANINKHAHDAMHVHMYMYMWKSVNGISQWIVHWHVSDCAYDLSRCWDGCSHHGASWSTARSTLHLWLNGWCMHSQHLSKSSGCSSICLLMGKVADPCNSMGKFEDAAEW